MQLSKTLEVKIVKTRPLDRPTVTACVRMLNENMEAPLIAHHTRNYKCGEVSTNECLSIYVVYLDH